MNKNDDRLFEQLFKVQYSEEFKQKLKNDLLIKYEKRRKNAKIRFFSSLVAACLLTFIIIKISTLVYQPKPIINKTVYDRAISTMEQVYEDNSDTVQHSTYTNNDITKNNTKNTKNITNDKKSSEISKQNALSINTIEKADNSEAKKSNNLSEKKLAKNNSKIVVNYEKGQDDKKSAQQSNSSKVVKNDTTNSKKKNTDDSKNSQNDNLSLKIQSEIPNTGNNDSSDAQKVVVDTFSIKSIPSVYYNVYEEPIFSKVSEYKNFVLSIFGINNIGNLSKDLSSEVYNQIYNPVVFDVYNYKVEIDMIENSIHLEKIGDEVYGLDRNKAFDILSKIGVNDYKIDSSQDEILVYEQVYGVPIETVPHIFVLKNDVIVKADIFLRKIIVNKPCEIIPIEKVKEVFSEKYGLSDINIEEIKLVYHKFSDKTYYLAYLYIEGDKKYYVNSVEICK